MVADARLARALPHPRSLFESTPLRRGFSLRYFARIRMRTAGKMCGVRVPSITGCGACPAAAAPAGHFRVDRAWRGSGSAIAGPLPSRLLTTWCQTIYRPISCHRPLNPPETACAAPCGPRDTYNTATSGAGVCGACGPVSGHSQAIEAGRLGRFA